MKYHILNIVLLFCQTICLAQIIDIRPQFGHDPLWGDVTEDGQYAVTGGRYSIILWNLQNGDAIIEQPFQCMDVHFVKGFPYYCVAADLVQTNGSLNSSADVLSIINLLTGDILFTIEKTEATKNDHNQYQLSIPFDSRGQFQITDNVGMHSNKWGGKLPGGISNVEISSDGKFLLVAGKHPVVWDLDKMKIRTEIPLYEYCIQDHDFIDAGLDVIPIASSDFKYKSKAAVMIGWRQFYKAHFCEGNQIIAGAPGGEIFLFSLNGDLQKTYKTEQKAQLIYDCTMMKDKVFATTSNQWMYEGDIEDDTLCLCMPIAVNEKTNYRIIYEIMPIPDKDLFICSTDGFNIYTGSLSDPHKGLESLYLGGNSTGSLSMARIDKDNIFITHLSGKYSFVNLETKEVETKKWNGTFEDFHACYVLNDGRILIGGFQGKIGVIKKGEREISQEITLGLGQIRGFAEDINRSRIYVTSSDGTLRILNSLTLSLIATCYNLGDMNSIVFCPDGYYYADKSVANLIMYGHGSELFSFDRFDLVKNRPDIIAKRLGAADEEVKLLERVYKKRLHRMGFEEEQIKTLENLPSIAITRFPSNHEISTDKITLGVQCNDKLYPIRKVFAWLNGTPLLGRDGMSVNNNLITLEFPILLSAGENKIEVSCINEAGVESLRKSRTISYINTHNNKNLYIVSLGVSSYKNDSYNLHYAAKDSKDITDIFQQSGKELYDTIFTLNLINQSVNYDAPSKIRDFLSNSTRNDIVIVFYAGHGLISNEYDYYLATYLTDFSSPETTAIKYEDFESIFDDILPLKKLFLIDACHSGEIDKEDVENSIQEASTKGKIVFRGNTMGKESIESQILRSQFNDIRRDQGTTILAGSNGMEVAIEGKEWQNGLFTWTIRQGLQDMKADINNDHKVTVSEMIRYTSDEVNKLSKGIQTPETRKLNPICNFVIKEQALSKKKD